MRRITEGRMCSAYICTAHKKIRRALRLWFFFLMVGVWQQIKVCIWKHASHQAEVRGGIYCVFIPAASHPHSYSCVPVKQKKKKCGWPWSFGQQSGASSPQRWICMCCSSSTPACLCVCNSGLVSFPQDYVGETPIHKAARAGSLECISALLIQGAKAE